MGISTKQAFADKGFKLAPEGTHVAAIVGYSDLGRQAQVFRDKKSGKKIEKHLHQIMMLFAFSAEGEFYTYSTTYTFSFGNAARLTGLAKAALGSSFDRDTFTDMDMLLGKSIMLGLVHKEGEDRTFVNVSGVLSAGGQRPNLKEYVFPGRVKEYYEEKYGNIYLLPKMPIGVEEKPELPF